MSARIVSLIVCDDVRKEINGKDLLIGVYSGDVVVASYPAVIQAALWIEVEAETGAYDAECEIDLPSANPPIRFGFHADVVESGTVVIAIGGLPFHFERDGELVVRWRLGAGDWEVAKRKRVLRVATEATDRQGGA